MKPTTNISIDGTDLSNFSHLSLVQRLYEHHTFSITIGHQIIETLGGHTLDKSKSWVGKVATITLGEETFVGLVSSVSMVHNHGTNGDLVIRGYSPTILLEGGPHLFSWTDKSLKDIVKETIDAAGVSSDVKPEFSGVIGYMGQHRESHYAFLKRLACQYNEWMFYDGEKLVFGKPGSMPEVSMTYGSHMERVEVSTQMRPVKSEAFSYHSLRDEQMDGKTKDSVSGLDELGDHGFNESKNSFGLKALNSLSPRVDDKGGLDDVLKKKQAAAGAATSVISGTSIRQELRPGVIADIQANINEGMGIYLTKPYGKYLITAVHHHATGDHVYSNHFEGIPSGVATLPEPDMKMPLANPQLATVMSNKDPEKKGRIQVQFQWQILQGLNTNWIRVMTPDGGISDNVPENRGYVFIPEEGDQVMVGFRYGDPCRPFVMGSMFHGKSGKGGGGNNKIKSITTRSGSTITFDDDEGDGKITISDPSGNTITLNGDGTMNISAPDSINMNSTEINIVASDTINILGENKVHIETKDLSEIGTDSVSIKSDTKIEENAPDVTIKGDSKVDVSGAQIDVKGTTTTNVKGGTLNLN